MAKEFNEDEIEDHYITLITAAVADPTNSMRFDNIRAIPYDSMFRVEEIKDWSATKSFCFIAVGTENFTKYGASGTMYTTQPTLMIFCGDKYTTSDMEQPKALRKNIRALRHLIAGGQWQTSGGDQVLPILTLQSLGIRDASEGIIMYELNFSIGTIYDTNQ